jgi:hypothetical protein
MKVFLIAALAIRAVSASPNAPAIESYNDTIDDKCACCGRGTPDAARAAWHTYEDGVGERHSVCQSCAPSAPAQATSSSGRPSSNARTFA